MDKIRLYQTADSQFYLPIFDGKKVPLAEARWAVILQNGGAKEVDLDYVLINSVGNTAGTLVIFPQILNNSEKEFIKKARTNVVDENNAASSVSGLEFDRYLIVVLDENGQLRGKSSNSNSTWRDVIRVRTGSSSISPAFQLDFPIKEGDDGTLIKCKGSPDWTISSTISSSSLDIIIRSQSSIAMDLAVFDGKKSKPFNLAKISFVLRGRHSGCLLVSAEFGSAQFDSLNAGIGLGGVLAPVWNGPFAEVGEQLVPAKAKVTFIVDLADPGSKVVGDPSDGRTQLKFNGSGVLFRSFFNLAHGGWLWVEPQVGMGDQGRLIFHAGGKPAHFSPAGSFALRMADKDLGAGARQRLIPGFATLENLEFDAAGPGERARSVAVFSPYQHAELSRSGDPGLSGPAQTS